MCNNINLYYLKKKKREKLKFLPKTTEPLNTALLSIVVFLNLASSRAHITCVFFFFLIKVKQK